MLLKYLEKRNRQKCFIVKEETPCKRITNSTIAVEQRYVEKRLYKVTFKWEYNIRKVRYKFEYETGKYDSIVKIKNLQQDNSAIRVCYIRAVTAKARYWTDRLLYREFNK